MRWLRRTLVFGLPSVAVVVALLAGVWWFFIRSDAHLATNAPEIPAALKTSSPVATRTLTQTGEVPGETDYLIVPSQSSASYFVGEKLASLSLPSTAKGTTTVSGVIRLVGNALAPGGRSSFAAEMTGLESDQSRRDSRVQAALDTNRYPTANFVAETLTGVPATITEGQEFGAQLSGKFTLHGVTREVTWDVRAKKEGNAISALATLKFTFADYNIQKPDIAGFVSVDDHGTIQVQLIGQKQ